MDRPPPSRRGRHHAAAVGLAMLTLSLGLVAGSDTREALSSAAATGWNLSLGADRPSRGFASGEDQDSGRDDEGARAASLAEESAPPALYWKPSPSARWQRVGGDTVDLARPADVYVLDLAATTPSTVAAIHARGAHAICRIEIGMVEQTGPGPAAVDLSALGKPVAGRPGVRYVDITRIDAVRPYLTRQLDECWTKGFDGVDGAAVDIATTAGAGAVGFPVTAGHEIALVRAAAALAHNRGLAFGLHAGAAAVPRAEQVAALEPVTDFAVVERCFAVGLTCDAFRRFTGHGKAVFHVEHAGDYPGATAANPRPALDRFCPATRTLGFSSILQDPNAPSEGWQAACP